MAKMIFWRLFTLKSITIYCDNGHSNYNYKNVEKKGKVNCLSWLATVVTASSSYGRNGASIFVIDTYEHAYPETDTLTKEYTRLRAILILNDIMIFTAWLYTNNIPINWSSTWYIFYSLHTSEDACTDSKHCAFGTINNCCWKRIR